MGRKNIEGEEEMINKAQQWHGLVETMINLKLLTDWRIIKK